MQKDIRQSNGVCFRINPSDHTSSIIKSDQARGDIFIPAYIIYDDEKYKITTIESDAFQYTKIDSLKFAEDSEITTFGNLIFNSSSVKKIQIPGKVKYLDELWCGAVADLIDIEISPKNPNFSYIENKYFVGKSQEKSDTFDVLLYARFDIKEAVIPPQIKFIKTYSFYNHREMTSLIFPKNSQLKSIEGNSLAFASISKLVLPASLETIENSVFEYIQNLSEIEVSPDNQKFKSIDKKYLLMKCDVKNKNFDVLFFCVRNIENAKIPSYIKIINNFAFKSCTKMKSLEFDEHSSLEIIQYAAFLESDGFVNVVLPPQVKTLKMFAFTSNRSLESLTFLSDSVEIDGFCFSYCHKLALLSFPNATKVTFLNNSMANISPSMIIMIRKDAAIDGPHYSLIKDKIKFFDDEKSVKKVDIKKVNDDEKSIKKVDIKKMNDDEKSIKKVDNKKMNDDEKSIKKVDIKKMNDDEKSIKKVDNKKMNDDEKSINKIDIKKLDDDEKSVEKVRAKNFDERKDKIYMDRIRYLESRLSKYEDVIPFDPNAMSTEKHEKNDDESDIIEDEEEERFHKHKDKFLFFGEGEESHQKVICKIGEGATSIAYKVVDERTKEVMCKKVFKVDTKRTTIKDLQNIMKEYEILTQIHHPCICECIAMNPSEKVETITKEDDIKYEDEEEEEEKHEEVAITTFAIYLKYHPFNLRECLDQSFMTNTLKVKIAVEIAFAMSYIHQKGMIHRDLKLENVMLNYIFEAQLIDFGFAHVCNLSQSGESLTTGVGTLAYMSPEMLNEEKYDCKTDVYSFGVLLFVLFTKHFPKQNHKDKLTNQKIRFPRPSSSISSFCIEIIKKCMTFEPSKRPSFDDILNDMFSHSFLLADEIDTKIVKSRYQLLNRFRSLNK